ncbi:DUF4227 domain-containing protein [Paenibacillus sediminis]|uniref:DUF4227 family protein n=1 Tax=Paenibacillus sediminis TaxID=664909 RepID=A0ABS4GZM5_9BACL|nr:DUF4227 family protein [Paenibacillus sediminis]MBP1935696.1 hypothetical protein [Paenibacillus sediminis]
MIISVRKWLRYIRYFIVFAALTVLMYKLYVLFGDWVFPVDRYRVPDGSAVRVFDTIDFQKDMDSSLLQRLRLYYWFGE